MTRTTLVAGVLMGALAATTAFGGFQGIEADLVATYGPVTVPGHDDPPETWTARVFAVVQEGDSVLEVYGTADNSMYWAAESQFYQNAFGGPTSVDIDPADFGALPDLAYDSWMTIGADDMNNNALQVNNVTFGAFEQGSALFVNNGGWSVTDASGQGLAQEGPDGQWRVLIAQLTLFGPPSTAIIGQVNLGGSTGDGGNWTEEGVSFELNFIPAPSAVALLGLGGLVGRHRRRH
ncbi:MAG: hypothetical protein QGG74_03620 [Phycisphaerales bacterium]|jgi:hypothetical protein|nr:hypothetical protein [Phycisphaerales bacterium]MDP6987114.1 hypothetical protein [Phycisphaerales bacterium]